MKAQERNAKRAMFVWLPNFAMTRARLKNPPLAKPGELLVLLEKAGNIKRIAALDHPAIEAGLHLQQPIADALAIYPNLVTVDAEPDADAEALTALAGWMQRFTPATAPFHPHGVWLDVTGCAHLWDDEVGLAREVLARLKQRGIEARAAIAPTFGAAFALAHHTDDFFIADEEDYRGLLTALPVERLRIAPESVKLLRKLGLFKIADVERLPRAGVNRRFPDLLLRLDQAMGRADEAIDFLRLPTPWIERIGFAEPVTAPEDIERVAERLLTMLNRRLEAERQGAGCFELSYFKTDGDIQRSKVATALPTREVKRIMRLFREKLGLVDPGFGIDAATIVASRVEPLEARQINLLRQSQEARCVEELAALVDSLQNRLGEARVFALAPHQSYIPERATKRISAAEALIASRKQAPAKPRRERRSVPLSSGSGLGEGGFKLRGVDAPVLGATPQFERPIRLFAKPQPIEATAALPDAPPIFFRWRKIIHRIARAEGPERICPEWWRDNDAAAPEEERIRDYYRVENTEGMRFWVFREGLYGGNRMPRWYIHGVFA